MKKFAVLMIIILLITCLSGCHAEEIYEKWNNSYADWRASRDERPYYGYICTQEFEAFILFKNGNLSCGTHDFISDRETIFCEGLQYLYENDDRPTVTAISDFELAQNELDIAQKIDDGINNLLDAAGENYTQHRIYMLGDYDLPFFCSEEDDILILTLPSEDSQEERAFLARSHNSFLFNHNMSYSGAEADNALLLFVGYLADELDGWRGQYSIN